MSGCASLTLLMASNSTEERSIYRNFLQQDSTSTYQIVECETVAEVIQQCQQIIPDVLLLDTNLSSGNGLDVLQQIKSQVSSRTIVIMLASREDVQTAVRAIKSGAQDYLSKGNLTASTLNQSLQEALHPIDRGYVAQPNQSQQVLTAAIALKIRQSLQLGEILSVTTDEVRNFLKTDRVLVYQFHPDLSGTIVAESVLPGWTATLGAQVEDTYFQQEGAAAYEQGRKQVVADIGQAGLSDCHVAFLHQFEVKAILVVPILVNGKLWGLLVAHNCVAPRTWHIEEVNLLEHLAVQIAIAIQQASAYEQAQAELVERIQVEKHLRESEERFRNTFEQAAVGIAHLSPGGQFIRLNQRFCEITSYTPEELLSLTFQEITHPDDLVTDLKQMQNLLLGKIRTYSVEKRYIRQDRSLVWINVTLSLVREQTGEPKYFISVIEDITIRRQSEAERLEAEKVRMELKLLDAILDTILAGYWDADLPNHYQYISPGFKRMFGYEDHELANSPDTWKQLIFPEDLPSALASYERHVSSQGQVPYYNELRYRHKNGSTIWVMCSGRVIAWDKNGNPLRMIGCHIDITQRKQAEEIIINYAREIQDLYNHAPCGYHSLDSDGHIININNTELQWLGSTREEVIGRPITDFMTQESVQVFQKNYPKFKIQGQMKDLELDFLCQDGTVFPVLISATAVKNEDGIYVHSRSTLFDIRERKQTEIQLRHINEQLARTNFELARATQMKDEFLANMSHELRTPLNAILGMSESLLEEVIGSLTDRQKQAISAVERSGQHLLGLINDILDVSKIESGKFELDITTVSISQLCQSSLSFVKQQALKKQVQLNLALPTKLGKVALDERRIRQVLINLLTNAVKFTPTSGRVTLEVHYEPVEINLAERIPTSCPIDLSRLSPKLMDCPIDNAYYLCLSVVDTGIGIAPSDQAKLFQPFVQIDSALNRQHEGTGLGLVLVKQIVELHGGDVSLASELGQGSCFTIRLPSICLVENPSLFEPSQLPEQSPTLEKTVLSETLSQPGRIKAPLILLAEDNKVNVITVSSYLTAKGYRLVMASDGQEAVLLAQAEIPDLILMDIQMPKMDGLEAMKQIRDCSNLAEVPIIALTALAMDGDRERCLAAGANDYLSKPVRLKELTTKIQQFLGSA